MSFSKETVNAAYAEAKRFVGKMEVIIEKDELWGKNAAAARRASMDLSRALADLRRPRWEEEWEENHK